MRVLSIVLLFVLTVLFNVVTLAILLGNETVVATISSLLPILGKLDSSN